ncbi:lipid A export ATP-binding/permease protein MsbA [Advenella faeciporci]|uniref:Lipid A export ATP-binding/permease protein MsbA n=1 Tax=Advenella faeciporci TaxID=797535 RepID=A0A918MXI8_9BURK|nr:lipid A export permease/ATP-binding protein MsbA [Advenella faeciporci]GGW79334.1 lipid A export ATP-binding/permease protein MsbA [Advenella faeciporci]
MSLFEQKHREGTHAVNPELWRKIYKRVGVYWKALAVAMVFVAFGAATQPAMAYIMKPLLDEGFTGAKSYFIWLMPLAIVSLFLVRGICNFLSSYLLAWIANNVLLGMRSDMYKRLLTLPDREFQKGDTGRLMNRFTIDAGDVTDYATEVFTIIVREAFVVLALLGMLLYLSWQLSLIIFLILPLSIMVARYFTKRLRRINRQTINMNAQLTHVVKEGIEGQRVVKLFDGYEYEQSRFSVVNAALRKFAMRKASADAAMTPLTQLCISFAVAAVIATALYQGNAGTLTVGAFVAFVTALAQIFDPIKRLTNVASKAQKMLIAAESVFSLIDGSQEKDQGKHELKINNDAVIEFKDVCFRFPEAERDTLSNISLTVKSGETIAFVGRSGSGKTTLANMIPRFIEPSAGCITINGYDIAEVTLKSLRNNLSLVSQNVVLFDGSIAQNVAYGSYRNATESQITEALKAANLLEFVKSLPNGLQTDIGENGAWLSGGQRQRLAIARALIKNAPILILDEATSALDNESERQVQASLDLLMEGRTTFVIAHRLSTVQNANCIVVLDHGRIVESGTHDELLRKGGLYATLYQMQFRED